MKTLVLALTVTLFTACLFVGVVSGQIGSGLEFGSGFSPVTTVTVTPTPTASPSPNPSTSTNPTSTPGASSSPSPTETTNPSTTQNPSATPNPTPAIPEFQILPVIAFIGVTCVGIAVFFYYNNKRKSDEV